MSLTLAKKNDENDSFFSMRLRAAATRIVRESDYSPASQLFLQGEKKTMTGNYHRLSQARSHQY